MLCCLCSPIEEFSFTESASWSLFRFCQFTGTPMFSNATCQLLILIWISWAFRSYTVLGRKEDKSWETKSCLKSSNLSYSLGKIQEWVLVNAEALGTCFRTSSRLQAWVEAPLLHFPCPVETCNSQAPRILFISFYIRMNSIFKTQNLYCTFLLHFSPFRKWNILDENRTSYIFLFYNLVIQFERTETTVLKYITMHSC